MEHFYYDFLSTFWITIIIPVNHFLLFDLNKSPSVSYRIFSSTTCYSNTLFIMLSSHKISLNSYYLLLPCTLPNSLCLLKILSFVIFSNCFYICYFSVVTRSQMMFSVKVSVQLLYTSRSIKFILINICIRIYL